MHLRYNGGLRKDRKSFSKENFTPGLEGCIGVHQEEKVCGKEDARVKAVSNSAAQLLRERGGLVRAESQCW